MSSSSRAVSLARGLLCWLAALLLRGLGRSWRIRYEGENPILPKGQTPVVGALWHRNLFLASVLFRGSGVAVPVSRSEDGELVSRVLWRLGFAKPLRGSSSRGGAAVLRQLLRALEQGVSVAILTDGPKGPARRSKLGVVALARLSGAPIVPASFSARPCVRVGSWDGSLVPLPFARVVCHFGEAIEVPRDTPVAAETDFLVRLDDVLNRESDRLDDALGLCDANRPQAGSSGD